MTKLDKELRNITEHFGVDTELMKLSEEIGELQGECYRQLYIGGDKSKIEDECADVLVVLTQIMLHYDVDLDKVKDIFEHKVERTNQRIKDGWYDKHR